LDDSRENNETYDRIGASVRRLFVECVEAAVTRNVLLDQVLINRLGMYLLAEPCGGDRMESDAFGCMC
jgi:hypothetical protein